VVTTASGSPGMADPARQPSSPGGSSMLGRLGVVTRPAWAGVVGAVLLLSGQALCSPPAVVAAPCVRIVSGTFNAPGNDNVMPALNGEYVQLRNGCGWRVPLTGYRVRDYGVAHTYRFPSAFGLGAYASVRLHSGTGTNSATNLYWGRTSGEVWNNTPPEWAYLVNAAGTVTSSWSWPLARVVSHGSRLARQLALTIDDGANPSICHELLTILEAQHASATWFPTANAVAASPGTWKEVTAAGFPMGDHTVNHPHMTTLSIAQQYTQIATARSREEQLVGMRMLRALRPPYGEYNTDTRRAATVAGFGTVVTWEATFADSSLTATVDQQVASAMKVQNGSVVLMHCRPHTPAILRAVLPRYRAAGFTFVTIGQMFGLGGSTPAFRTSATTAP